MSEAPSIPPPSPPSDTISFEDFVKVKLRIGRVTEAIDHPNADRLLVLQVDLGDEQRQICAGLKGQYTTEELVGKNLVIVSNLAPRRMRGLESQGMLLAATNADGGEVVILSPAAGVAPGSSVG